jgi:hypothetical protein
LVFVCWVVEEEKLSVLVGVGVVGLEWMDGLHTSSDERCFGYVYGFDIGLIGLVCFVLFCLEMVMEIEVLI